MRWGGGEKGKVWEIVKEVWGEDRMGWRVWFRGVWVMIGGDW